MKPKDLGKVFGGTGSGVDTVIYLSGIIKGTFYYNDVNDLTGEYKYTVTCTTDSDKKVFCTVNAEKEETVGGTVKHYYWKFVASDAFGKDELGKEDDVFIGLIGPDLLIDETSSMSEFQAHLLNERGGVAGSQSLDQLVELEEAFLVGIQ
ncbi:hypothetical protein GALMADRAFT_1356378 [Galerina marginata CBS 339.88]|uniref:Uncharacterized protein n=1 Tax=Galerina marginata (strain CBS 339.88) TaxID=685588 RepID=A0A067SKS7_GALM3|nr:hypothetical protein GALMADRAFT_1356378 [Galerina marginata CBS 339.88]